MATKKPEAKKVTQKGDARSTVEAFGEERVLELLREGQMLTDIAREIGVSRGSLTNWIEADADRSVRVREARSLAASAYDEMALDELRMAQTPFELSRGREIASHLRWRASKLNAGLYGDKTQTELKGDFSVAVTVNDEQAKRIAQEVILGNAS